jgi:hypothetical protein
MSPAAQDALQKLLHESEGQRLVAVRSASSLSDGDAAAVFEALVERVELQDDLKTNGTPLVSLCDWCKARSELRSQCIAFFGRVPAQSLPLNAPLKIVEVAKGTDAQAAAADLLKRWSQDSSTGSIATSAASALNRLEK